MTISRLPLYALILCLVACGGGGGGGVGTTGEDDPDDTGHESFDPPVDNAEPLEYQGSKFPAVLDATNVGYFVYNTFADSEGRSSAEAAAASVGSSASFNITGISHAGVATPRLFQSRVLAGTRIKQPKKPVRSSGTGNAVVNIAAVSDSYDYAEKSSESCESGQVDTYLMMYDDGSGLMVLDYRDCREDGAITDGLVTYDIYEADSIIRHALIRFNRLRTRVNGVDYFSGGSIEFEYNPLLGGDVERRVMNVIYEVEDGGMLQLENMVFETQYEDTLSLGLGNYSETISGRIYDSFYGHVDIETLQPVGFVNHIPQWGELMLVGGEGSRALLEFPGGSLGFTVRLDADGNEDYENSATLNLARLDSAENDDIRDDDGDGIHNSWETFHGLNPEDPTDAGLDLDGDAATNLIEYRLGFDPGDDESTPGFVDLEISRQSLSGGEMELVVRNNGPAVADAHVMVRLPDGFEVFWVTPASDCEFADGGNIVTCDFAGLAATDSQLLRIGFDMAGNFVPSSYQAVVFSNSFADHDESNNVLAESITTDLRVSFLDSSTPSSYVVQVENIGLLGASEVYSQLVLPAGVADILVDASASNGLCSRRLLSERWLVRCQHHGILPGQVRTVTVSLTPAPGGEVEATFVAGAALVTPEYNLADNLVSFSGAPANLISDVGVTVPFNSFANTGVQWNLRISPNTGGPNYQTAAKITVDLPPEFEFISADQEYQCTSGHPLVCTIPRRVEYVRQTYPSLRLTLRSQTPGIYEFPVTIETEAEDPDLSNNNTLAFAFVGNTTSSIEAQINAANAGDTIEVPAGYYNGSITYTKDVRLVGIDGAANTFWGGSLRLEQATDGEITGFTFAHGNGIAISALVGTNVHIHHNVFERRIGPVIAIVDSDALAESNIFRHISCNPESSGVVTISRNSSPLFRNNLFLNNTCTGIFSSGSPDAIFGDPVIVNNTFSGNSVGAIMPPVSSGLEFYFGNNIFHNNGVALKMAADCGSDCPAFSSNLLYGNDVDYVNILDQTGTNGNISGDPLFTDAANEDFTLQSGSPAIDAGDALNAPSDDFAGNSRPVDGDDSTTAEPDIGAYEFQAVD